MSGCLLMSHNNSNGYRCWIILSSVPIFWLAVQRLRIIHLVHWRVYSRFLYSTFRHCNCFFWSIQHLQVWFCCTYYITLCLLETFTMHDSFQVFFNTLEHLCVLKVYLWRSSSWCNETFFYRSGKFSYSLVNLWFKMNDTW